MSIERPRVRGVNHITLTCADLNTSISFYVNTLNAALRATWARGAYVEVGPLWLCLELGTTAPRTDDSHIALDCAEADFEALASQITSHARLWKTNRSEGASIYFLDPDGHKLELHAGSLDSRLAAYADRDDITLH